VFYVQVSVEYLSMLDWLLILVSGKSIVSVFNVFSSARRQMIFCRCSLQNMFCRWQSYSLLGDHASSIFLHECTSIIGSVIIGVNAASYIYISLTWMIWECLDQDCQDPLGPHMLVMFNRSQPWFEPQKRKQTRLGRTCSCFKLNWFQSLWWFEGNDRSMVIRGFHSTLKSGWFCLPHSAIDGLHLGSVSGRMRQGCLGFAWTEKCQWRLAASFLIPFWFFGHLFMWYPDILQAPPG
jgi:hypothetical protein